MREDLRESWRQFMQTEAFEKGIELLERTAVRLSAPGPTDSLERKSAKLDSLGGAISCIKQLRSLAQSGKQKPAPAAHPAE